MKTILILGDSWGVPNYYGLPGPPFEEHAEYRLRELGYRVYNCSLNGGSNIATVNRAKEYLSGEPIVLEPVQMHGQWREPSMIDIVNPVVDWIIWFQTEFFRYCRANAMKLDEAIIQFAHHDYNYVFDFIKTLKNTSSPDLKVAVIGGQSPIIPDILYQYYIPDFMVQDWRSEIVGRKLPEVHALMNIVHNSDTMNWVNESFSDSIDVKIEFLDKCKIVLDSMIECEDFPDNCHPGSNPHKLLTEKLHSVFTTQ